MKSSPWTACALPLALLLAGCAVATGYERIDPVWNPTYGYRDRQIAGDEYSVAAVGNVKTTPQRVAELALLRAARLAREQGRSRFLVVQQKVEALSATRTVSLALPIGGLLVPVPVATRARDEPAAALIIRLIPDDAATPPAALDAGRVIEALAPRFK
jgi:hypothetical protein